MSYNFEARAQRILLPVNPLFVITTMMTALVFNLLPWRDIAGIPDILALVLGFWCINQPRKIGVGTAWLFGLIMDTGNGALLGQHAFAYAVLAFAANTLSRRILWFPIWPQALHVFLLLLGCQGLMLIIRLAAGSPFPGVLYFSGSIISAVMWPLVNFVLLSPQRRPESVDENRPI